MATVTETVSLDASPDQVWAFIGGFDSLDSWHPAVASSKSVTIDGSKVRNLTLGDGSRIVERLDSHGGKARNYVYTILEAGPLPVQGYQSTIKVTGDGPVATVTWSSKFEPRGASEADAKAAMSGVYTAGFAALLEKFGAA